MKILVTPLYGIGDTLMMTPALEIIKKNLKDVKITVLTMFTSTRDVLLYNPNIDELLYYPLLENKISGLIYILKNIRPKKFDYVINFYPTNRREYNIFSFLTGSKNRLGHSYKVRNIRELNFLKNKRIKEEEKLHNVLENVKLLKEFLKIDFKEVPPMKIYLKEEEIKEAEKFLKENKIDDKFLIGIHAGSSVFKGHKGKRWDIKNFEELLKRIRKKIEKSFFLFFGSKDDEDVNTYLEKNIDFGIYVREKSIREVASIIKKCKMFITNDSGLMHLAAASGIPVLALFGPTSPYKLYPWGVKHKICFLELDCSPCFAYSPKPLICVKGINFKCMKDMSVSYVWSKFLELLSII